MREQKATYPNVRCGTGHPDEPGYVICAHVLRGDPAVYHLPPSVTQLGLIRCDRPAGAHKPEDMKIICRRCAALKGLCPN